VKRRPAVLRHVVVAGLWRELGEHGQLRRARCVRRHRAVGVTRTPRTELTVGVGDGPREIRTVTAMVGARIEDGDASLAAAGDQLAGRADRTGGLYLLPVRLEHVEDHKARGAEIVVQDW